MSQLQFDDQINRLMDEFNASYGATRRRNRLLELLELKPGDHVLDVGSGPGHYAREMSSAVGENGVVAGLDIAESSLLTAQRRCSGLSNVGFHLGDATALPFDTATFDAVLSSQTFEYLPDVDAALGEIFRVLKPGGRLLVHDTEWGAVVWYSRDAVRMDRIMNVWDSHLVDPHVPQSLGSRLVNTGFKDVSVEPLVQLETTFDPASLSAILIKFVVAYVTSQHVSTAEATSWEAELCELGSSGAYFFSANEYIFTAIRP